nr:hypothetical protein [Tanacetum cinerariifolium]
MEESTSVVVHGVNDIRTNKPTANKVDCDSKVRSTQPLICPTPPLSLFSHRIKSNKNIHNSEAQNKAYEPQAYQNKFSYHRSLVRSRSNTHSSKSNWSHSIRTIKVSKNINTTRKKRFASLRLIDTLNGVRGCVTQPKKNRHNCKNITHPVQADVSSCGSENISNSLSKIEQCNNQIKSNADHDIDSDSNESGGILAVWDTSWFTMTDSKKGMGLRDKELLWNDLTRLIDNHNDFSIILGDFNEVRSQT